MGDSQDGEKEHTPEPQFQESVLLTADRSYLGGLGAQGAPHRHPRGKYSLWLVPGRLATVWLSSHLSRVWSSGSRPKWQNPEWPLCIG